MSEKKDTNPKDAIGSSKAPMSAVPCPVLLELGLAMLEGSIKYGRHNWRAAGVRSSVYYDAAMRHLFAWWEGEDVDPDSGVGISHLTKAMACLAVIRDAEMRASVNDDRPPRTHDGWVKTMNSKAGVMLRGAVPVDPVTHRGTIDRCWEPAMSQTSAYDDVLNTYGAQLRHAAGEKGL